MIMGIQSGTSSPGILSASPSLTNTISTVNVSNYEDEGVSESLVGSRPQSTAGSDSLSLSSLPSSDLMDVPPPSPLTEILSTRSDDAGDELDNHHRESGFTSKTKKRTFSYPESLMSDASMSDRCDTEITLAVGSSSSISEITDIDEVELINAIRAPILYENSDDNCNNIDFDDDDLDDDFFNDDDDEEEEENNVDEEIYYEARTSPAPSQSSEEESHESTMRPPSFTSARRLALLRNSLSGLPNIHRSRNLTSGRRNYRNLVMANASSLLASEDFADAKTPTSPESVKNIDQCLSLLRNTVCLEPQFRERRFARSPMTPPPYPS